eukprot:1963123-Rhodomonas_salina.1
MISLFSPWTCAVHCGCERAASLAHACAEAALTFITRSHAPLSSPSKRPEKSIDLGGQAAAFGHLPLVEALLELKADPNVQ